MYNLKKYKKYKEKYINLKIFIGGTHIETKSKYNYLDHPNMIIKVNDKIIDGFPEDNENLYLNKFLYKDQIVTFEINDDSKKKNVYKTNEPNTIDKLYYKYGKTLDPSELINIFIYQNKFKIPMYYLRKVFSPYQLKIAGFDKNYYINNVNEFYEMMGNSKRINSYKEAIKEISKIPFNYGPYNIFVIFNEEINSNIDLLEGLGNFEKMKIMYKSVSDKRYKLLKSGNNDIW